jgi:uncharacterized protein YcbK (DUF882 family)
MITMKELNPKNFPVQKSIQDNLDTLLKRINEIRTTYGKPMKVTSGLRTMEDHLRIYAEMGITDKNKIPMKSRHLFGEACDVSDPDGKLMDWCIANEKVLEKVGLWCEVRDDKKRVHFQIVPPQSGKRFFNP